MRRFLDAIADSYFSPQEDGTVRFAISNHGLMFVSHDGTYLVLDAAEAEAMKILWRPTVRYYIYAIHACIFADFFARGLGLLPLFVLWLAAGCLFGEIRRRNEEKALRDRDFRDPGDALMSRTVSHPVATSLWVLTGVIFYTLIALNLYAWDGLDWLDLPELPLGFDGTWFLSFALVTFNWHMIFRGIAKAHREKESAAQAKDP